MPPPTFSYINEINYQNWLIFSNELPVLNITAHKDIREIRKQWTELASIIIYKRSTRLRQVMLFAMTRLVMKAYAKEGIEDAVHLQAIWLYETLEHYSEKGNKPPSC